MYLGTWPDKTVPENVGNLLDHDMARKRHLLRREVTYEDVKDEEFNILHQLEFHGQQLQFFTHLWDKRDWMKTVVAHHLNLASPSACEVSGVKDWLYGSFNVCVPITINYQHKARVLLRFPLPYRVGEAFNPGNGDEKIRCEAATYAWLQENCSDIPIPQLYGFSLSSGEVVGRKYNIVSTKLLTLSSSPLQAVCHCSLVFTSTCVAAFYCG